MTDPTSGIWAADFGIVGRFRSDIATIKAGNEIIAAVSLLYPDDKRRDEAVANAYTLAAGKAAIEALKAYQKYNDHDQDEAYDGCDGDCDAAIELWLTAERLADVALAATTPPSEPRP